MSSEITVKLLPVVHDNKPDKVQNGVGPDNSIVSISTKYSERQDSDVLSVY